MSVNDIYDMLKTSLDMEILQHYTGSLEWKRIGALIVLVMCEK